MPCVKMVDVQASVIFSLNIMIFVYITIFIIYHYDIQIRMYYLKFTRYALRDFRHEGHGRVA